MAPLNDLMELKKGYGCLNCRYFAASAPKKLRKQLGLPKPEQPRHTWGVRPRGADKPFILFVGEAPGRYEDIRGKAFVGLSGKLLVRLLRKSGLLRDFSVRLTNVVRCQPPYDSQDKQTTPTVAQARPCSGFLRAEILKTKPKVIVALGAVALKVLTGATKSTLREFVVSRSLTDIEISDFKTKLFAAYHPAYIARNEHLFAETLRHFKELRRLAHRVESRSDFFKKDEQAQPTIITDVDEAVRIIEKIRAARKMTAYDIETLGSFKRRNQRTRVTGYLKGGRIAMISLCNRVGKPYCIVTDHDEIADRSPEDEGRLIGALGNFFADWNVPKVAHNKQFDDGAMSAIWGIDPNPSTLDTMLMGYVLDETRGTHGLDALTRRYLPGLQPYKKGIEKLTAEFDHDFTRIPLEKAGDYNARDADATLRLYRTLTSRLGRNPRLQWLGERFLPHAATALQKMERTGAVLDFEAADRIRNKFEAERKLLSRALRKDAYLRRYQRDIRKTKDKPGKPRFVVNLRSSLQIARILYDYRGYPSQAITKTGKPSTAKDALIFFAYEFNCDFSRRLMRMRLLEKLRRTYIDALVHDTSFYRDGFIHANFSIPNTATGRLCVDGDTLLETSVGSVAIRDLDLTKQPECRILTHKGREKRILQKIWKGKEAMYDVVTESGKNIRCTAGHQILTRDGWRQVRHLKPGEYVVTVRDEARVDTSLWPAHDDEKDTVRGRFPGFVRVPRDSGRVALQGRNQPNDFLSQGTGRIWRGVQKQAKAPRQRKLRLSTRGKYARFARKTEGGFAPETTENAARPRSRCLRYCGANGNHGFFGPKKSSTLRSPRTKRDAPSELLQSLPTPFELVGAIESGDLVRGIGVRQGFPAVFRQIVRSLRSNPGIEIRCQTTPEDPPPLCDATQNATESHSLEREQSRNMLVDRATTPRYPAFAPSENRKLLSRFSSWARSYRGRRVHSQQLEPAKIRPEKRQISQDTKIRRFAAQSERRGGQPAHGGSKNSFFCEEKIKHITPAGVRDVWDITVERDHSYVAQGLVHHNTSDTPNLQNLPNKGGGDVKRLFVSRFGPTPKKVRKFLEKHYNPESPNNEIIREGILRRAKAMQFGAIVSFDYNQIELRVLAALSGDKTMQRIYLEGGDIHLETTLHTFQLNREEYDRADPNEKIRMRTVSKKLNFSASYGSSGHGVRSMLAREDPPIYISERDADRFVARHWAKYKGMARWSQQTIREIRKTKKAVSEFGRVRRLPEIHSSSEKAVAEAERQGVNDKIQSVASDITLTATVVITQRLEENGLRSKVWLVVHDSIILDCPIEEIEIAVEIAESTMTNLPRYARKFLGKDFSWDFMGPIPLTVKGEIGPNYRDLEAFSSPKDAIPAFAKAVVAARKRDRQDERLTDVEKIKV